MSEPHPITRWFRAKPAATNRQRLIRRYAAIIVGTFIVLLGIIIAPLPGPGFMILGPLGLGVLATELVWARRALKKLEQSELGVRDVADKIAVRISRWVVVPGVAGYWGGVWWVAQHGGVDPTIVWAGSFPAFVPFGYLAIRIVAVRPARGRAPESGTADPVVGPERRADACGQGVDDGGLVDTLPFSAPATSGGEAGRLPSSVGRAADS